MTRAVLPPCHRPVGPVPILVFPDLVVLDILHHVDDHGLISSWTSFSSLLFVGSVDSECVVSVSL